MPNTTRVIYTEAPEPDLQDLGETVLHGHALGTAPKTGGDAATERLLAAHEDEAPIERAARLARAGH